MNHYLLKTHLTKKRCVFKYLFSSLAVRNVIAEKRALHTIEKNKKGISNNITLSTKNSTARKERVFIFSYWFSRLVALQILDEKGSKRLLKLQSASLQRSLLC